MSSREAEPDSDGPAGVSPSRRPGRPPGDRRAEPTALREVTFPGSTGAFLNGFLDLPADGGPVAWALFAHCFTGSKAMPAMREIAGALTGEGGRP